MFEITNGVSGNPKPYNKNYNDIIKDQIIISGNGKKETIIIVDLFDEGNNKLDLDQLKV